MDAYKINNVLIVCDDKINFSDSKDVDRIIHNITDICDIKDISDNIDKIVLFGDTKQISMSSFLVVMKGRRMLTILSDVKWCGAELNKDVTRLKEFEIKEINEEKYLILVDRNIRFHFEAFYLLTLLRKMGVDVDICEGNEEEYNIFLSRKYQLIVHFGHSDGNYIFAGAVKTKQLPQTNCFISFSCNSYWAYESNFCENVNSFCGNTYWTVGQTPMNDVNLLQKYVFDSLFFEGTKLSEALNYAKKKYMMIKKIKKIEKSVINCSTYNEYVDYATLLSSNVCGNWQVEKKIKDNNYINLKKDSWLEILPKEETVLIHIEEYEVEDFLISKEGTISKYTISTDDFKYLSECDTSMKIIGVRSGKEVWLLINIKNISLCFMQNVKIKMYS